MHDKNRTVEILEGNPTLQKLMIEVLIEVGLSPTIGEDAKLLVIDVDSGLPNVNERIAHYEEQGKSVLVCGLRHSREFDDEYAFVERPFSLGTFVVEVLELLGITREETTAPAALFPNVSDDSTEEIPSERIEVIRQRLSEPSAELAAMDYGDDAILEVFKNDTVESDGFHPILGHSFIGNIEKRLVSTKEIQKFRRKKSNKRDFRSKAINQTMPDTPIAIRADSTTTGELSGLFESSGSLSLDMNQRDLDEQIRGVAHMLAQSWQRIALTARTDDRSDRIERVLKAAFKNGLRGASEEVQRIPPASGFAGGLEALSLIDVLRTIRDRRLRGRLEIAIGESAFLLHIDGAYLDAIELLSGDTDMILLDILRQGAAIDAPTFSLLKSRYENEREEHEPLEMYLISAKVVSISTLQSAKVVRSRELFKSMCGLRGGQFAFLEVRHGGQWPNDSLRINHDEILLEILRESSFDTGDSQATARTRLTMDPARAASFTSHNLTELERSVLLFFRKGETLAQARERLEKIAGTEAVDRVVNRLKKLELLKRSAPQIQAPNLSSDGPELTVVSSIPKGISEEERNYQRPTQIKESFEVDFDHSDVGENTVNRKDLQFPEDLPPENDDTSEN